jgi:hypothetical protein
MKYKLGRKPVRHDDRTFAVRDYLPTLPDLPPSVNWGTKVINFGMLGNDTVGDCTIAGAGHAEVTWTANASVEFDPSTEQIIDDYSAITGYDPEDPSTDQGANMLDVLKYWRQTGIVGQQITAFMSVDWKNQQEVMASVFLFGCCYIGVNLPQSAEDAFNAGQPWTDVTDQDILGGHCVLIVGYDPKGVWLVTWAKLVYASWAWLDTYCEEAYCPYSRADWIESQGECPAGFDDDQLEADLASLE